MTPPAAKEDYKHLLERCNALAKDCEELKQVNIRLDGDLQSERERADTLEDKLREQGMEIKRYIQESTALTFQNEQMRKRIMVLQEGLSLSSSGYDNSCSVGSEGAPNQIELTLAATENELKIKIEEIVQAYTTIDNLQDQLETTRQAVANKVTCLENELQACRKELQQIKTSQAINNELAAMPTETTPDSQLKTMQPQGFNQKALLHEDISTAGVAPIKECTGPSTHRHDCPRVAYSMIVAGGCRSVVCIVKALLALWACQADKLHAEREYFKGLSPIATRLYTYLSDGNDNLAPVSIVLARLEDSVHSAHSSTCTSYTTMLADITDVTSVLTIHSSKLLPYYVLTAKEDALREDWSETHSALVQSILTSMTRLHTCFSRLASYGFLITNITNPSSHQGPEPYKLQIAAAQHIQGIIEQANHICYTLSSRYHSLVDCEIAQSISIGRRVETSEAILAAVSGLRQAFQNLSEYIVDNFVDLSVLMPYCECCNDAEDVIKGPEGTEGGEKWPTDNTNETRVDVSLCVNDVQYMAPGRGETTIEPNQWTNKIAQYNDTPELIEEEEVVKPIAMGYTFQEKAILNKKDLVCLPVTIATKLSHYSNMVVDASNTGEQDTDESQLKLNSSEVPSSPSMGEMSPTLRMNSPSLSLTSSATSYGPSTPRGFLHQPSPLDSVQADSISTSVWTGHSVQHTAVSKPYNVVVASTINTTDSDTFSLSCNPPVISAEGTKEGEEMRLGVEHPIDLCRPVPPSERLPCSAIHRRDSENITKTSAQSPKTLSIVVTHTQTDVVVSKDHFSLSHEQASRENLMKKYFTTRMQVLDMKLLMAKGRSAIFHEECVHLMHLLAEERKKVAMLLLEAQKNSSLTASLRDELATTNENYIVQITLLTQRICDLETMLL